MNDSTRTLVYDLRAVGTSTLALIESATGVITAPELAAVPGVERIALGSRDLAAELRVDPDNGTALNQARLTLVLASAAAGLVPPIDGVTARIDDAAALSNDAHDARDARALGFGGKLCIHPRQVPIVNGSFCPTAEEVEWAQTVIAALEQVDPSARVVTFRGSMIDKPVILRAKRILGSSGHPRKH
jgi:citrate lyase subunit beta/citryl-CoA lyase